jgi:transposase-like protein
MSRGKVSVEEHVEAARLCTEGKLSQAEAARKYGVEAVRIQEWERRYKAGGALAFKEQEYNKSYSAELKQSAVEEYLAGKGPQQEIAAKYGLRSTTQLRDWIKVYNSGKDFGYKITGGSRMKQGRETSQEERISIAKDCLENGSNYGEAAIKYNVSYQQVYTWAKKFRELGEAGLEDRRGKRTADQEPRTELEELKTKMAQLEHENYMLRMERDLLKKVEEYERRDAFRK